MTAPGTGSGEGRHDEHANPPSPGAGSPEQPGQSTPWESSAPPPAADYPPAGYPPPPPPAPPAPPGEYYPTPDYYGGYGGYGPPEAMQPTMNRLAIGSLVASFTGLLCGIGGIVAIVLGAIALDQIKRTRQDGYGLAVAGIVIGIAMLIVNLIVTIFALHSR